MSQRTAIRLILLFSGMAVGGLFYLIYGVELADAPAEARFLPAFNALCNAASALAVVTGLVHIRRGRKRAHGISMIVAFIASALFLTGYILHHTLHGDTPFRGEGWIRPVYFAILISHILLSMVVLPMVLTTFFFAATRRWPAHRRLAKWTYPVWLYVSVTGVLVFFFLRFLNPV